MKKIIFLEELDKIFTTENLRTMVSGQKLPTTIKVSTRESLSIAQIFWLIELADNNHCNLRVKESYKKTSVTFIKN